MTPRDAQQPQTEACKDDEVQEAWRHQMTRLVNNEERRLAAMDVIVRSRIPGLDMWLAELLTAGAALAEAERDAMKPVYERSVVEGRRWVNRFAGFSVDADVPATIGEPGSLPPAKGHTLVPKPLLDAAEARLREVEAERDLRIQTEGQGGYLLYRSQSDLRLAAEADAKALADAASKMPDAGLDENDPRYRWWWDVMAPALAAHRERVK